MYGAVSYPIAIVELDTYAVDADRLFDPERHERLKEILAFNPEHGDIIDGTGGVRQFIWPVVDGAEEEVLIVYFFHDLNTPLFLVAILPPEDGGEFDEQFCGELMQLTTQLLNEYENQKVALMKASKNSA